MSPSVYKRLGIAILVVLIGSGCAGAPSGAPAAPAQLAGGTNPTPAQTPLAAKVAPTVAAIPPVATLAAGVAKVLPSSPAFQHIFIIVLENKARASVLSTPYFKSLADRGLQLTGYYGVAHPSQPNYIAMIAGDPFVADDSVHNLSQTNLVDLMDAAGVSWKVYEENLPSPCYANKSYTGAASGEYVRTHNPFVSFDDIRNDPKRCGRIVNADQLAADIASHQLSAVNFYIPNKDNDMHNTSIQFGADWLHGFLDPKLSDPNFMKGTLVVVTFDEDDNKGDDPSANPLYAVLLGPMVHAGATDPARYTHYSLLRTIEDNYKLGTLQRNDASAQPFARCDFTGGCN